MKYSNCGASVKSSGKVKKMNMGGFMKIGDGLQKLDVNKTEDSVKANRGMAVRKKPKAPSPYDDSNPKPKPLPKPKPKPKVVPKGPKPKTSGPGPKPKPKKRHPHRMMILVWVKEPVALVPVEWRKTNAPLSLRTKRIQKVLRNISVGS